jgi:anti-anti-sigma factor
MRCVGDEDIASQSRRRAALSRALTMVEGELIVDLRELTFADTSLMLDLAIVARRLRRAGSAMRLCDAQPQVQRIIETVGLHRLPSVVLEKPALA